MFVSWVLGAGCFCLVGVAGVTGGVHVLFSGGRHIIGGFVTWQYTVYAESDVCTY